MGKPDDIPPDLMAIAESIAADLPSCVQEPSRGFAANIIARAILAERERCAKVAEAKHADETDDDPWSSGWRVACNNIAAAIRKGSD